MSTQNAASGGETLAFDQAEWERRLDNARARRAEVLRRRMEDAQSAAPKPARDQPRGDGPGSLSERLAEFEGHLASTGDVADLVKDPPARPPVSMTSHDPAGSLLLAERLDRLRNQMPSTAPIAAEASPPMRAAKPQAGPAAPRPAPSPAVRAGRSRARLSQVSIAFALGLAVGLPAAWLVPRLIAPVAQVMAVSLSEDAPSADAFGPVGGFAPPAGAPEPGAAPPGAASDIARAPRPTLPDPPISGTSRADAPAFAPRPEVETPGGGIAEPDAVGPAAEALQAARLFVYVPDGSSGAASGIAERLRAAGASEWSSARSPHTVGEDHIRYYHPEDRAAAEAAASATGAEVRDFTSFRPSPDRGLVEIWLSGTGAGRPAEARASSGGDPVSGFARSVRELIETFPANERP